MGVSQTTIEPDWLRTAGQIAGTLLMVELILVLLIVCAVIGLLAYAMWWLHRNVIPVIGEYSEQAQQIITAADRSVDRVAQGVASFHGVRKGVVAGVKAFFVPPRAAAAARQTAQRQTPPAAAPPAPQPPPQAGPQPAAPAPQPGAP